MARRLLLVEDSSMMRRMISAMLEDEGYEVAWRHFNGDRASRIAHRFNVEKIVWAYRLLRLFGR